MKGALELALAALLPAAINPAPAAAASGALVAALCAGGGAVHHITVPIGDEGPPVREGAGCCAKGCHAASRRRRNLRQFEPAQ